MELEAAKKTTTATTTASAGPTAGALIAALPDIKRNNDWTKLSIDYELTPLTGEVLMHLLGIPDQALAQNLCDGLKSVMVLSVAMLLTAAEDISKVGNMYQADGMLATINPGFLQLVAALRDKVKNGEPCFLLLDSSNSQFTLFCSCW